MQKVDRILLKKYFDGTCTAAENAMVRTFLSRPESASLLEEFLEEQQPSDYNRFLQEETVPATTMKQWQEKIHQLMKQGNPSAISGGTFGFSAKAAAILVVLLGLLGSGIYLAFESGEGKTEQLVFMDAVNPKGQRATIMLADSTKVFLGPASKLTYPTAFPAENREVFLEGEAFFEVKRNTGQPFIVHTGPVQTRVLGTSFKVNAFADAPLSVSVVTGSVEVKTDPTSPGTVSNILRAGEKLTYTRGQPVHLAVTDPDATDSWKNARLVFSAQPLADIFHELERWHRTEIRIEKKQLAAEQLTVTITATMPLSQIMNILSAAGKFRYEIKANYVRIY